MFNLWVECDLTSICPNCCKHCASSAKPAPVASCTLHFTWLTMNFVLWTWIKGWHGMSMKCCLMLLSQLLAAHVCIMWINSMFMRHWIQMCHFIHILWLGEWLGICPKWWLQLIHLGRLSRRKNNLLSLIFCIYKTKLTQRQNATSGSPFIYFGQKQTNYSCVTVFQ